MARRRGADQRSLRDPLVVETPHAAIPEQAKAALAAAAWTDVRVNLFEQPVLFDDPEEGALYVRTILLRDHIARMP